MAVKNIFKIRQDISQDIEIFRHYVLNAVLFTVREGMLESGSSIKTENDSGLCSEKEVRTKPASSSVCL